MKKATYFALASLLGLQLAAAVDKQPTTPQIDRGRELFLNSPKGTACATCHTLAGVGTAVGPDLTKLAVVGPRGIVSAIRMTMTEFVQEVRTTTDGTFPGIKKQQVGDEIEMWDLSQIPPTLRKLTSKQIVSAKQNRKWRHPPALAGYTSQELADLVAFVKWAASGTLKEIAAAECQ
jgi:mono/diheme cytochrome c family protein